MERPSKGQRDYYSGKKRRHTLKTEVRIDQNSRIIDVSKCFGGRTHDFKLHKHGDPLPHNTRIYADSGYQGLRKLRKAAATPETSTKRKRRRKALTERQKQYNHILRRLRIKVEHTFCTNQEIPQNQEIPHFSREISEQANRTQLEIQHYRWDREYDERIHERYGTYMRDNQTTRTQFLLSKTTHFYLHTRSNALKHQYLIFVLVYQDLQNKHNTLMY